MPGRNIQLVNGNYYHVLNRGVASQKIFNCERDYFQFIDRMKYYQNNNLPIGFAQLMDLPLRTKNDLIKQVLNKKDFVVEILAYCLMPNHFHLILKQLADNGISKFISNLTNGYTRYYNIKHKRIGPIFQGKFKAIEVESDEQLAHLSRYVHSNPFSAGIIKSLKELAEYPYSSFAEFIEGKVGIVDNSVVMGQFTSPDSYRKFVFEHADYQQSLQVIKKLTLEF